jgi:hypothetical protein
MSGWLDGLKAALWRVKQEILGTNRTLICNSTPGPYMCDSKKPSKDCPCDGANEERFYGGNKEVEQVLGVGEVDRSDAEPFTMLIHVPHANEATAFNHSVVAFLSVAQPFMYHGSGFGYQCGADQQRPLGNGWLPLPGRREGVEHACAAPTSIPRHAE